jgi:hypothetical protein
MSSARDWLAEWRQDQENPQTKAAKTVKSAKSPEIDRAGERSGRFDNFGNDQKRSGGKSGVTSDEPAAVDNDDAHVVREERAAIVEFDGRAFRPWAEEFARLCTMTRPPNIPQQRWERAIDDGGGSSISGARKRSD